MERCIHELGNELNSAKLIIEELEQRIREGNLLPDQSVGHILAYWSWKERVAQLERNLVQAQLDEFKIFIESAG